MNDWIENGNERKREIRRVIGEFLPPRLAGAIRTLKFGRAGWLTIQIDGIDPEYRGLVNGLLLGRNLVGRYFPDAGPQDCWSPEIHWECKSDGKAR